jgi:hypothetical protein
LAASPSIERAWGGRTVDLSYVLDEGGFIDPEDGAGGDAAGGAGAPGEEVEGAAADD